MEVRNKRGYMLGQFWRRSNAISLRADNEVKNAMSRPHFTRNVAATAISDQKTEVKTVERDAQFQLQTCCADWQTTPNKMLSYLYNSSKNELNEKTTVGINEKAKESHSCQYLF